MNQAVYQDPDRFAAAMLALGVHVVFFALLYFGFSWQSEAKMSIPQTVELWKSLPRDKPVEPVVPQPVVEPEPVLEVQQPKAVIKPDIVIPDKKSEKKPDIKPPEKKPEVKPPAKKPDIKPPEKKPEVKPVSRQDVSKVAPQPVNPSAEALQAARDQAAQEAATGRVMDEYIGKIQGKIKRNTVMPPDVPNEARAEFMVTLLPGGRVLSARLSKSSGNPAYDNAVERAILKSDPLPLPADTSLFSRFRELKLTFKPVE